MTTPQDPFSSDQPAPGSGPKPGQGAAPGYGQAPPAYGAPAGGYGQSPGYGAPPPAYGTPPAYGAPGAGAPFGQPGGPQLAGWGDRAVAFLIDYFGPALLAGVVSQFSQSLGSLLVLAAVAWGAYNGYLQGSTGQSTGKKIAGTRLLREQDGQVLGGGLGVGRFFLHILDSLPCYLGFLWPIWDDKKQTFADKLVKSVVIKA